MARGWESKSVEAQQADASRPASRGPAPGAAEVARQQRRRALELSRTRAANDLSRATVPAHRKMLEDAIADLDRQLAELAGGV